MYEPYFQRKLFLKTHHFKHYWPLKVRGTDCRPIKCMNVSFKKKIILKNTLF